MHKLQSSLCEIHSKLGKGFLVDLFILLLLGRFTPTIISKCLEKKESESPVVATKALAVR